MDEVTRLKKEIEKLERKLSVTQRFCVILKCHSCVGYYAQGYVCDCGRDHSYSDKEWAEYADQKFKEK